MRFSGAIILAILFEPREGSMGTLHGHHSGAAVPHSVGNIVRVCTLIREGRPVPAELANVLGSRLIQADPTCSFLSLGQDSLKFRMAFAVTNPDPDMIAFPGEDADSFPAVSEEIYRTFLGQSVRACARSAYDDGSFAKFCIEDLHSLLNNNRLAQGLVLKFWKNSIEGRRHRKSAIRNLAAMFFNIRPSTVNMKVVVDGWRRIRSLSVEDIIGRLYDAATTSSTMEDNFRYLVRSSMTKSSIFI